MKQGHKIDACGSWSYMQNCKCCGLYFSEKEKIKKKQTKKRKKKQKEKQEKKSRKSLKVKLVLEGKRKKKEKEENYLVIAKLLDLVGKKEASEARWKENGLLRVRDKGRSSGKRKTL